MRPGDVVAGRFTVERLAGQGGMGTVYRARDAETGGAVALKVVASFGTAERFEREADLLASLDHAGIVRHVAHGTHAGQPFLAMEWLEGEDLAARLARSRLSEEQALGVVRAAADALGHAHARGVVHRDVKPSNLFLVGGDLDAVRVLDFGVARAASFRRITGTGAMVGTLGYFAPEQARGLATVDARADVFSLGCVLFECMTGESPFAAEDVAAELVKVLLAEPKKLSESLPDVAPAVEALVHRMLAKEPAERPADGRAVADAIDALGTLPRVSHAPPAPSIPPGEQRWVSLVLASHELAHRAASAPTSPVERVVEPTPFERLGVRLEVLADGSVAALVGSRGSATDVAVRAARAALALRAELPDAAMAIASGRTATSAGAPAGEVVERAARELRRAASTVPCPIAIDDVTAGLLDARFEIGGGEAGLVLRAERLAVDTTRRLLGKPTPFVGRDRELAALVALFDECVEEGVARVALVTAPAGAGKSRLRHELTKRLEGHAAKPALWVGWADVVGAGSAFGLLIPALRREAGVLEGEPLAVRQKKLRARVARTVADADRTRVTEFLGELVGTPFPDDASVALRTARSDARAMGDQIRLAFQDFLAAECAAGPVVLVLEDVHWGDKASIDLLDLALRNLGDKAWLVLGLARPEVKERFPGLWEQRDVQETRLGPLTKRAAETLVRAALGDAVEPARVAAMTDKALGNAFALEELVRAEAEGRGDRVPETVLAMTQQRLDALGAETRRALRAASVFGQRFWRGGVSALLEGAFGARALDAALGELEGREVIRAMGEGKVPGEREFLFTHALVREAAYASLTEEDRRLGHRLAGGWLEGVGSNDAVELAEHFERGAVGEQAARWYARAAELALGGNDLAGAISICRRGLSCPSSDAPLSNLLLTAAVAHKWREETDAARANALKAMNASNTGGDVWWSALGEMALLSTRSEAALHLLGQWSEVREFATDYQSPAALMACARLCIALWQIPAVEQARQAIACVDAMAERAKSQGRPVDPPAAARIYLAHGMSAILDGDWLAYLERSRAARQMFKTIGDDRSAVFQRLHEAEALAELGQHQLSRQIAEEVMEECLRLDTRRVAGPALHLLAELAHRRGDLQGAARHIDAALALTPAASPAASYPLLLLRRAAIALDKEQVGTAIADIAAVVRTEEGRTPTRAMALALLGLARAARSEHADATSSVDEAVAILRDLPHPAAREPFVRLARVLVLERASHGPQARDAIRAARKCVLERARTIANPEYRRSFLDNVPENRRTLELAREWLGEEPEAPPGDA